MTATNTAIILASDGSFDVEVTGQTVLDAIQETGTDFSAPCGGNGTCKKCQVLIHDAQGMHYLLACRTELEEGMTVHVESQKPMTIAISGEGSRYFARDDIEGYGVAIDIGTTTVVCRLHDLSDGRIVSSVAQVNPQVVFGGDVISRITACMDGHLDDLTNILRDSLDEMIDTLCKQAKIKRSDIQDMTVVGNTVMEHIAAHLSPIGIGVTPFKPLSYFGDSIPFEPIAERAYFTPALSGYVGGDITAGLLAAEVHKAEGIQVFMDLGTNGELAIGSKHRIICCATAAGPVFEGAFIHFGMPAREGAISSVKFDGEKVEASVIGDRKPVGVCGTGIIEAIAVMIDAGIVDGSGRLLGPDELEKSLHPFIGMYEGKNVFYLTEDKSVFITQIDVRNLQLAKAAICAGILTLLKAHELTIDDVDSVLIAGGFGSYLSIDAAATVGLFPKELSKRTRSVGNTAIEGASILLTSLDARSEVAHIAETAEYIELSTSIQFNEYYMKSMSFKTD